MANELLRSLTGIYNASIVSMTTPMRSEPIVIDRFDFVIQNLFPLCMVLMYILPILRLTSRIVSEKHSGLSDFLRVMSLSNWAYWLSWCLYYFFISLILSLLSLALLSPTIFPLSNRGLLFLYLWLYSLSHLGYTLMMSQIFARFNVSPRASSILSTLVFFLSFFVDRAVDSHAMSETRKGFASLIPNVAMSRGFMNIAAFEKGGAGLQNDNLTLVYMNHKVSSSMGLFVASAILMSLVACMVHNFRCS